MTFLSIQAQEDTVAAVDTLSDSYEGWEGTAGFEDASMFVQAAASYDLIFIVLGVSLIIWFILLFFIIRVDKKIGRLEDEIQQSQNSSFHET